MILVSCDSIGGSSPWLVSPPASDNLKHTHDNSIQSINVAYTGTSSESTTKAH